MYISLSFIGMISVTCFSSLFLMTIAVPAALFPVVCVSLLKYHVYSFLASLVSCLPFVSCNSSMSILFVFIHISISSLVPGLFVPCMFSVEIVYWSFCFNFVGCLGYRALALSFISGKGVSLP